MTKKHNYLKNDKEKWIETVQSFLKDIDRQ
jgi:hypothetical protein